VSGDDEGARKFIKEKGITFPSLKSDFPTAGKLFGVQGTPTNLVIDPTGRILFKSVGFNAREGSAKLAGYVEAVLFRYPPSAK